MHVEGLRCVVCGDTYPADEIRYECSCGGSLDVAYDYDAMAAAVDADSLAERAFGHRRYRAFLPDLDERHIVSMGEGGTRLVPSRQLGDELGVDLYFKLESANPTGSFKDRGTVVELGQALRRGRDEIVVASTGNMGASIAAYTARAGVTAHIYVPDSIGGPKYRQMQAHGADITKVDGDYSVAAERAWRDWAEDGVYLMGDYPYRGEGEKTLGHEIADTVDADTVVVPVGNGTLIHGTWKGLREFERVGLADGTPRMVGVQAAGCNTVVNALQKGYERVEAVDEVDTVAGAIACADPLDGDQALQAMRDSDGFGVAVDDDAIMAAKEELARREGIYAEEAAAAAWAGMTAAADRFGEGETVVLPVCGHGLKT